MVPPPTSTEARVHASQPAARQRPKSPNRVLAEAEEQWVFSEAELLKSPSILHGMSIEKEKELRAKGVNFIRQVGIMLKLPELTLSTAAIFFNRYLMRVSLVDQPGQKALHHYTLGATCLFLATKVEESCRKMKDIVVACCRVAQKNPNLVVDEQSKDFWRWRDTILFNEDVLLEVLCFDLTIEAPHKQLFEMLKFYRVEHNKQLRNAAWAFVTDSNMTQLCLISTSRTIAAAALYAAARMHDVRLPDTHNRPWWEEQGVGLRDMIKATNFMCQNYETPPQKGEATGLSGAAAGGQSIYVGLFTDLDDPLMNTASSSHSDYASAAEDLPPGQGGSGGAEELPWDRTRLKAEQGITSPLVIADVPEFESSPKGSTASQGSVKRTREASINGETGVSKRRKLTPQVDATNGNAAPARTNGKAETAAHEKDDVSEEGEVDE